MARARAASEPPHMARYRGRVYFCFPCRDRAGVTPQPHPCLQWRDAPGAPHPPSGHNTFSITLLLAREPTEE